MIGDSNCSDSSQCHCEVCVLSQCLLRSGCRWVGVSNTSQFSLGVSLRSRCVHCSSSVPSNFSSRINCFPIVVFQKHSYSGSISLLLLHLVCEYRLQSILAQSVSDGMRRHHYSVHGWALRISSWHFTKPPWLCHDHVLICLYHTYFHAKAPVLFWRLTSSTDRSSERRSWWFVSELLPWHLEEYFHNNSKCVQLRSTCYMFRMEFNLSIPFAPTTWAIRSTYEQFKDTPVVQNWTHSCKITSKFHMGGPNFRVVFDILMITSVSWKKV